MWFDFIDMIKPIRKEPEVRDVRRVRLDIRNTDRMIRSGYKVIKNIQLKIDLALELIEARKDTIMEAEYKHKMGPDKDTHIRKAHKKNQGDNWNQIHKRLMKKFPDEPNHFVNTAYPERWETWQ
jgi:hypothetical protein